MSEISQEYLSSKFSADDGTAETLTMAEPQPPTETHSRGRQYHRIASEPAGLLPLLQFCIRLCSIPFLAVSPCPTNCVCQGVTVTCTGPMDLTQPFPNSESIRNTLFVDCIINEIPTNAFSSFLSVESFQFQRCDIGIIRGGAFDGMSGARVDSSLVAGLLFYNARIGVIEQEGLSGVRGFYYLKLNGTTISRVKSGAIAYSEFENIQIFNTDFSAIEPYVFAYDLHAVHFSMTRVRTPELPERMFAGLEKTEDIFLAHSSLGDIRPRAFSGLSNVTIGITKCILDTLSEAAFSGVRELQSLTISESHIRTIQGGIFGDVTAHSKVHSAVYISQNTIDYLLNNAFTGLIGFSGLYFNGNSIGCWEKRALDGVEASFVYDTHNDITTVGGYAPVENCRRYSQTVPVGTVWTAPRVYATLPATPARVQITNSALRSPSTPTNVMLSVLICSVMLSNISIYGYLFS